MLAFDLLFSRHFFKENTFFGLIEIELPAKADAIGIYSTLGVGWQQHFEDSSS